MIWSMFDATPRNATSCRHRLGGCRLRRRPADAARFQARRPTEPPGGPAAATLQLSDHDHLPRLAAGILCRAGAGPPDLALCLDHAALAGLIDSARLLRTAVRL